MHALYTDLLQHVPTEQSNLSRRYDRCAGRWPYLVQCLGMKGAYRRLMENLKRSHIFEAVLTNGRVLDSGIGAGDFGLALGAVVDGPLEFYGVDISPQMLQVASARFASAGFNGRFFCEDSRHLPWSDNSFDLVLSAHMLEHLPDPIACLEELARVLQPGGVLILLVTRYGLWGRWLQLRWQIHPVSKTELQGWLAKAGLRETAVFPLPGFWHSKLSLVAVAQKANHRK